MQGKRKAEGIALLSFYNDDEEDEDEYEEEGDLQQSSEGKATGNECAEQDRAEISRADESSQECSVSEIPDALDKPESFIRSEAYSTSDSRVKSESFVRSESYLKSESFVKSESYMKSESYVKSEGFLDRFGNGTQGIIVDYAHDDPVLSPESEEAENFNVGRAVIGLNIQNSNGLLQGVTPPSGRILTPEAARPDDRIEESKVFINQDHTVITDSVVDMVMVKMADAENGDTITSETDPLADFLPPHPTEKCSDELQQKFAKYLALKNAGRSFNEVLRKSKGYRNPDFLQRAVKYQEIDQIGSCFKKEIFDPHGYNPTDFYDTLVLDFKREQERKEQSKKQSQMADFVHGAGPTSLPDKTKTTSLQIPALQKGGAGAVINPLTATNQGIDLASATALKSDTGRSSKSKWDKLEPDSRTQASLPSIAKTTIAAASAHAALLTANAGGGYASFAQQKRKEAEGRSRGFDKISDRK